MDTPAFIYLQFLRTTLLPMTGVTEKLCFGTPAFYVNNKLFCRMREDGETLAVNTLEREAWIKANPEVYFVTDHYLNYDYMLVRLDAAESGELKTLLLTAWKNRANKTSLKQYEQQ